MSKRGWWIAAAGVALAVALGAGLVLALGGGGGSSREQAVRSVPTFKPPPWRQLWASTHVGESKAAVLARWPKPPYQHYHDNLDEDCYEWQDDALYNLCFMHGRLHLKALF